MENKKKYLTKKRIIILSIIAAVSVVAVAICLMQARQNPAQDEHEYITSDVSHVHMTQTITASGNVTTGDTTKVDLVKGRAVRAVVVEQKELVQKGEPLVYYTDGSHTDAPVSGVIGSISAPKSRAVCSSSNNVKIENTQKLYLKVMVPEDRINEVTKGNSADIVINAYSDREYTGKIIKIQGEPSSMRSDEEATDEGDSNEASESEEDGYDSGGEELEDGESEGTAYYAIDIAFENDGDIRPGMSASAVITVSDRKDVLAVPVEAVNFTKNRKKYVELIDGKKIQKAEVRTGDSDPMNVEILSGLNEGDKIRIRKN